MTAACSIRLGRALTGLSLIGSLFLAACTSKTATDWKAAKDASTSSAYAGIRANQGGPIRRRAGLLA